MFQNMSLNKLTRLGLGLVISLLIIVSSISFYGLSSSYTGFVEYRTTAIETNLLGRIQANLLMVRLSVLKYINFQDAELVKEIKQREQALLELIAKTEQDVQDSKNQTVIQQAGVQIKEYERTFVDVEGLFALRDKLVKEQLDPTGKRMADNVKEIMRTAYRDDDVVAAYYAGLVLEEILLGRLYAVKYLVTNQQNDYERANDELTNLLPRTLNELDREIQNPIRRQLLAKIRKDLKNYTTTLDDIQQTIVKRNGLINNKLNIIGPQVAQEMEDLKLSIKARQDELGPNMQSMIKTELILIAIVSVVSVSLGIAIAVFFPRIIKQPIGGEPRDIEVIANKVASGDLSMQLSDAERSSGIYKAMGEMTTNLRSVLSEITEASGTIAENTSENSAFSQISGKVYEQKSMADSIAVAMTEMTASIQEVSNNADSTAALSNDGALKSDQGRDKVSDTIENISQLADTLQNSVTTINKLEDDSKAISAIVDVIENISEQTNLLALNAAIEAARAGEHGRGFAVVADEVRQLAKRTSDSTIEIQQIVETLQQGTSSSVKSMDSCYNAALETVDRAKETSEMFDEINSIINQISEMITHVATAVNQQSSVVAEINSNVDQITAGFTETTEIVAETQVSTSKLKQVSNELTEVVGKFKLI